MIKVIVIDDQPLEGKMIAYILEKEAGVARFAGQAYSAREGVALARQQQPDIAFLDITMPGQDGTDAIRDLRQACPELRIVMLTAHDDFDHVRRAMREGANDYLLKPTRPKDVLEAIRRWSDLPDAGQEDPVAQAKRYVEDNLQKSITLAEVAERLYLSPTYFSRLFKQRSGCTFSTWLAQRRIQRAQRYLDETNLAVADIATRVGYQEANSFTRLFKQATGLSPTEYRKSHRDKTRTGPAPEKGET